MSIASAPAACSNAGSWAQQWSCGWNANKTGAHVIGVGTAMTNSHNMNGALAAVAIFVIVLLLIGLMRSGSRRPAASRG